MNALRHGIIDVVYRMGRDRQSIHLKAKTDHLTLRPCQSHRLPQGEAHIPPGEGPDHEPPITP